MSSLNYVTTAIPLFSVLFMSAVKDAVDDIVSPEVPGDIAFNVFLQDGEGFIMFIS